MLEGMILLPAEKQGWTKILNLLKPQGLQDSDNTKDNQSCQ